MVGELGRMLMRSGSTMSLSNRSKMPIPSDPSAGRQRRQFSARSQRIQSASPSVPPDQPTRVYGVEVDVDGLRSVGVDLHHGRGGEHQDVRAGRVLRGAQLRRLHVERRAAAEHRARRHGI